MIFIISFYFSIFRYVVLTQNTCFSRSLRKKCTITISCVWAFSLLLNTPKIFTNKLVTLPAIAADGCKRRTLCGEYGWTINQTKSYALVGLVMNYVLPVIVSSLIYGKVMCHLWQRKIPGSQHLPALMQKQMRRILNRKTVCRRISRFHSTFVITHLPLTVVTVLWYFGADFNWKAPSYMWVVAFHAELVHYANSAINPLLLCGLDPAFRLDVRMSPRQQKQRVERKRSCSTSGLMIVSSII